MANSGSRSRSSVSSNLLPRNVVIAGETGVGKSSFINLVTGLTTAKTGNDARGVSTSASRYPWETENQTHIFHLWDTPGFGESSSGNVSSKAAQDAMRTLLRYLSKNGGVHLLVLCMRGTRVTPSMKQTYDIILSIRNQVSSQIPIVAVITELEKRCNQANIIASMEEWWTNNKSTLAKSDMTFCEHACLTTLDDKHFPRMSGRRDACQRLARNLLIRHSLPPSVVFTPGTETPPRLSLKSRNVVITGESSVGKSSFINLITGIDTTAATNDIRGVTTQMSCHLWETEDRTHAFRLWDMPRLGEGSSSNALPNVAHHALRFLLRELVKEDEVHLLVVCMRGVGGADTGMKRTYDAIRRIRDQVSRTIPVVAVITGLEKSCDQTNIIPSMDEWWKNNESTMARFDMMFDGHACLTTFPDDCHPPVIGRYAKCQQLAQDLLMGHSLPLTTSGGPARMMKALSSPSTKFTRNIIVVGGTGAGKSSTINLVVGANHAVTSNDVCPTTVRVNYHDWDLLQTQTFRLWDTLGLGDGPIGSTASKHAYNALQSLLTELGRGAGVHLIIVCLRGGPGRRVSTSVKQTYDKILAFRNHICPDTPLIAVVTELERYSNTPDVLASMEKWWESSTDSQPDRHMAFAAHACITNIADEEHPPIPGRRDDCQRLVRDLIIDHALTPHSVTSQDLHVILFGETGVGKSSLVNLLAGWRMANISPDSVACTLDSTEYHFQLGAATIRLWDTAGLVAPEDGPDGYMGAIEKAVELIQGLSASGGVSLFLFCIRGKVTATTQSNYRLFYEVLGRKQVPIAAVVTHLEREPAAMEDWWDRNAEALEKSGIHVSGHACITTLEGHPKYDESRDAVRDLFRQYADQRKFSMPRETWLGRVLSGLSAILGFGLPKEKELVRVLTKRCHLDLGVAQRVAACIENAMD